MTRVDELFNNGRTDETCSTGNKNTHILILLSNLWFSREGRVFTRLASRLKTFIVINRHSRIEEGRPSISITSCNQSSAEISACSAPNTSLTALKNADNSRSAIDARSGQG